MTKLSFPGLEDALNSVAQPLSKAQGLPNCTYTESELFRFERDKVMAKTWTAIAFGSELPSPGYAKPIDFMGIPLLIIRDNEGKLKVFHNVCSHRGMILREQEGPVKTMLRCPYHSWCYDLDGHLLNTPHVGGMGKHSCDGFERSCHGLKTVRSAEWMDVVFINLSGNACEFENFLEPLLQHWEKFGCTDELNNLFVADTGCHLEFNVDCNWKLPVENYCEAYHLPWVHPELNSYSPLDQHYNITISDTLSGQGSRRYQPTILSNEKMPTFSEWPKDRLQQAEYLSVYPNLLLGLQIDHTFAVILLPKKHNETIEKLQINYIGPESIDDRFTSCRESILENWNVVFSQDIFAVEGMQRGRESPGFQGGVFTPVQDVPTHHFHQWVASYYAQGLAENKS